MWSSMIWNRLNKRHLLIRLSLYFMETSLIKKIWQNKIAYKKKSNLSLKNFPKIVFKKFVLILRLSCANFI